MSGPAPDRSRSADESEIRALIAAFALAVERGDQDGALGLLCAEEVAEVLDSGSYDPHRDGQYDTSVTSAPVTASDIVVTGDVACARVAQPGQEPATLWFRREGGAWKVCAPAGDD